METKTDSCSLRWIAVLILGMVATEVSAGGNTADYQWQKQMLLTPTQDQLQRERQGYVFVYSGLQSTDIEMAMDSQYERIGNMMFVNTGRSDPEDRGEQSTDADSGC